MCQELFLICFGTFVKSTDDHGATDVTSQPHEDMLGRGADPIQVSPFDGECSTSNDREIEGNVDRQVCFGMVRTINLLHKN
jgi:hypothetical protein